MSEQHEATQVSCSVALLISPTGFVTDHTDFSRVYNKIELRTYFIPNDYDEITFLLSVNSKKQKQKIYLQDTTTINPALLTKCTRFILISEPRI